MSRRIVVHSLRDAQAAAEAAAALGLPLTLMSAPGAGCYAGPGWFRAVVDAVQASHPAVPLTAVLCCGDEPGTVLAALRAGFRYVRFSGLPATTARLAAIAAAHGAVVEIDEPGLMVLDLLDTPDPGKICRDFLSSSEHIK